ncbi:MAG: AAA family ATPase [Candidatus Berkelbacteria bacterium]|nr:AAA family ATPase [Candidatus Berkelbacteria bacterium]
MIIGVVGLIASGKDEVAEYLEKKGFEHHSLSSILREILKKEGVDATVDNLTQYGNKLRDEKGAGYLAKIAHRRIKSNKAVISSIRQVGEIEYLKKIPGFFLVKVTAPIEMRFERVRSRGRAGDVKSVEDLRRVEKLQASGKGGGMNMDQCMELADFEIKNVGTFDELHRQVDGLLEKISKKE